MNGQLRSGQLRSLKITLTLMILMKTKWLLHYIKIQAMMKFSYSHRGLILASYAWNVNLMFFWCHAVIRMYAVLVLMNGRNTADVVPPIGQKFK